MPTSDTNRPLVSISCTTYNHEKFIGEAIESFLMQETSFPFEILVHDDASTDGTAEVIRTYTERRPDLIKPLFQVENQFSQGKRPGPQINYPRALGKYIALCEGDDYWTDPTKLQQQVEYLESHPAVFLCGHAVRQIDEAGNIVSDSKFDILDDQYFTQNDIAYGAVVYPTLSVMFRNSVRIPDFCLVNGDAFTFAYFSNFGDAYISKRTMGVHRAHAGGIWTSMNSREQYDAKRATYGAIPRVIVPARKSLAYLRLFGLALRDYKVVRKLRTIAFALLMALVWLRPNSIRYIWKDLVRRLS